MAKRAVRPNVGPLRVLLYLRVSTEEQATSGAGLAAQEAALRAEAERRGWDIAQVIVETGSGKSLDKRPGITQAIERLSSGEADALAVAKIDRLSRSVLDFATLLDRSRREGWSLVALDMAVDTTTAAGEAMAHIVATFAQMERRLIAERTRAALAAKRAAGVRLGRPRSLPIEVIRRIVSERADGRTLQAIADGLTGDAVPTGHGGLWRPGTVSAVLRSQDAVA